MNRHRLFRAVLGASILPALLSSPGCVVWEIRDEMKDIHASIAKANATLDQLSQERLKTLDSISESLARADESLATIDVGLARIDQKLDTVSRSLASLDEHLASLRKTINSIDSAIPFLKVSGDDAGEKDKLEKAPPPDAPKKDGDGAGAGGGETPK